MSQTRTAKAAFEDAAALIKGLELLYLQELESILRAEIRTRKQDAIRDASVQIQQIAASVGLSVNELIKLKPVSTKQKSVVPIKYTNPDNPKDNWTGRGRKPYWLVNKLNAGAMLDSFLVNA